MKGGGYARRLAAILSADVAGYSRLMGEDDAATVRTLTGHLEAMTTVVEEHRGRVVDAPGDNLLAEFPSVVDALSCAVAIQEVLAERNATLPEDRVMRYRIGVNLGDVIVDGDRIYGDGINIAARIEALAEPGGVSFSGTVYEHVHSKLDLGFEYQGEQQVKNIANPVQIYRVVPEGTRGPGRPPLAPRRQPAWRRIGLAAAGVVVVGAIAAGAIVFLGGDDTVPVDGEKPTLAVLPFDNMSGDPGQEYFSDGITEDLITDLSKVSGLHVVARNSVFVYKGQAVDIGTVAAELGVRYVLEGSIRREADTIRINAQLIDSTTGGHVWAERYDRGIADVFSVQDDVAAQIVEALSVALTDAELEVLEAHATDIVAAYDLAKRGSWFYNQYTPEANLQARELYARAVELDPGYAAAYAGLGLTHYEEWAQGWSSNPQTLDRAYEMAVQAIGLDPRSVSGHVLLGHVYLWQGGHDAAIAELETAIQLEPSNADLYRDLAEALVFAGDPAAAIPHLDTAVGLNPNYRVIVPFTYAFAYSMLGRFDEAITSAGEAIRLNPNFIGSYLVLAFVYSEQGETELASAQIALVLDINPELSLAAFAIRLPYKDPELTDRFIAALTSAGLD